MSILVVGDSFSASAAGVDVWPSIIGSRTGKQIINKAKSGAGYWAPGADYPMARFSRQLLTHREYDRDAVELVIIFGSVNDNSASVNAFDHLRATIFQTHLLIGSEYPNAKHLIIGPQWAGPNQMPWSLPRVRDAILESMWGFDWTYRYIDPIEGPPSNWWFPPNRLDILGGDQFHPNQAGQVVLANRIEPHVRAILGI